MSVCLDDLGGFLGADEPMAGGVLPDSKRARGALA